ncbi:MAG: polysaccharide deacetylase family protein [Clostridia bacterium]|nr:polysaccharide deacetylase family protein [Clostridia bacterium]
MIIKFCRFHVTVLILAVLAVGLIVGICTDSIAVISTVKKEITLPVITYGKVIEDGLYSDDYVTADDFEKDLDYLTDMGYEAVLPAQVVRFASGEGVLPSKPVMLTFDEAHVGISETVRPLLERYSMKASIFVTTGSVDSADGSGECMDWKMLNELAQSGIFSIESASHNMNSINYRRNAMLRNEGESIEEYEKSVYDDVAVSFNKIALNTGVTPVALAYPFGQYSAQTVEAVQKAGVAVAFTNEEKLNVINNADFGQLLEIGRFKRSGTVSTAIFFDRVGI